MWKMVGIDTNRIYISVYVTCWVIKIKGDIKKNLGNNLNFVKRRGIEIIVKKAGRRRVGDLFRSVKYSYNSPEITLECEKLSQME